MDSRVAILRHFPKLLERWRGAHAQIVEVTSTHRTLRIILRHTDGANSLLIACIDPQHIEAPMSWTSAEVVISIDERDGFFVSDEAAGVRIRTGGVEVKELTRETKPL